MDLGEGLYRAATGRRGHQLSTASEPGRLIGELRAAYPPSSPPPGVSTRTWRRLRNQPQWHPSARIGAALRAAQLAVRLSYGRGRATAGAGFRFMGDVQVSQDRRERREITAGNWLGGSDGPAATAAILSALGRRDLDAAAYTLTYALSDAIGQEVTVHSVQWVDMTGGS
jgi:hypothetical protein